MFKQTPKKRVLFVRRLTPVLLALFGVFSLIFINFGRSPQLVHAVTSNTINFQARLQTAAGGIVPDGDYNVEFKLYTASSGGSAVWTEDYTYNSGPSSADARLHTVNGYLTANLGSLTAFSGSIDWSQQMWLTMNIGGTVTSGSFPTMGDGEMSPRLQLTAVPYAFQAGRATTADQLSKTSGSYTSTLGIQSPTVGNQTFQIQDQGAAGTYNVLTAPTGQDGYVKLQSGSVTQQTGAISISGALTAGSAELTSGDLTVDDGSISLTDGTLTLGGTSTTTFHTPGTNGDGSNGANIPTKINIPLYDPGNYGQIIALGLPSSASSSARAITVLDARSGGHQPSIAVLSPDEDQIFGLSWDGSSTTPTVKSTTNNLAFQVNGLNAATVGNSSGTSVLNLGIASNSNGNLQLSNSSTSSTVSITATGTSASYTLNLPGAIGSTGNCLAISGVTGSVATLGYSGCLTNSTAFVQGGNSFGAAANLGTADNNALNLVTNGTARVTVAADGSTITFGTNTDLVLQGSTAYISNTQGQTGSEAFGNGATVNSTNSLAVGHNALAGTTAIAIGASANNLGSSGTSSVVIGYQANASSSGGISLGAGAYNSAVNGIAIGVNTDVENDYSIGLGTNATTTANNQLVIGGDDGSGNGAITQVVIGNGVSNATPAAVTLQATSASGTNNAGADLNLASGASTGTASGGNINFKLSTPGTTGSTGNIPATVASLSGATGAATFQNLVNSTAGFQVQTQGGAKVLSADTSNSRVGIGNVTPSYTLDVAGDVNTTGNTRVGGTIIVDNAGHLQNVGFDSALNYSNLQKVTTVTASGHFYSTDFDTATGAALTLGTANATNITVGATGSTSTLTLGQSTASNTINIGNGNVASGTQTIAIGTGSSSTGKDNVTLGSMNDGSTTVIQGGTGAITLQSNGGTSATTGTIVKSATNNSTGAFQVQNSSAVAIFNVDTSGSVITMGSVASGNYVTVGATGLTAFGTAQHAKSITLPAEYAGAALDSASDSACSSANAGTMTSGYDGVTTNENYYKWVSTASAQCYDVIVRVPIPTDFGSWAATAITVNGYTTNTSTGTIKVEARTTGNSAEAGCTYANVTPGSTSTWSTANSSNCTLAGTYTPGGVMTLRIRLTGNASSDVRIGTITLNYNSKF